MRSYSVKATAAALGVEPRTVRRWIAAGQVEGAQQVQTPTGPAWTVPLAAVEALRSRVARTVEPMPQLADPPVQVEHSPGFAGPPHAAKPEGVALAVQLDSQAGQLGAALVALASQQAAAIAAQARQVEAARDDSLWWRCEALDLRQQLDQVRAQLAAAQVEAAQLRAQLAQVEGQAAQLRAVVEHHQRPTVPLAHLRAQLRAVEGGAA